MAAWEVLIAGGGAAGMATALALRRHGHSVLVVERTRLDGFRPGEVLSPDARGSLEALGVWERFSREGHRPSLATCSAWGRSEPDTRDLALHPYGPGWSLDRCRFDAMLAEAAREAGAVILTEARLARLSRRKGGFVAELARGGRSHVEEARLVVDASGRAGGVACSLGARRVVYDRLVALMAVLEPRSDSGRPEWDAVNPLLLEAAPEGWWYSVLLPRGALLVAYMTDGDLLSGGGLGAEELWATRLERTEQTRARTRGYEKRGRVRVANATTSHLDRSAGEDWLAVGDAASAYDPLSARGIRKALDSACAGADALHDWLRGRPGAMEAHASAERSAFERYWQERNLYYGAETRWPESLFWRRRRGLDVDRTPIRLDPDWLLQAARPAPTVEVTAESEGVLPATGLGLLRRLCETPRPTHEVVKAFQGDSSLRVSSRELIVALQFLIGCGALQVSQSTDASVAAAARSAAGPTPEKPSTSPLARLGPR